jgi:choline-sulfatase
MNKACPFMLCTLLAGAVVSGQRAPGGTRRPDVFLITVDTLRSDHVHCYGYEKIRTPAMDALAKQGIRFAEAFTPSPITNSSHASILTGLLPSSHDVNDFGVPLAATHATLAELLEKQNYQTAAFIGSVILDSRSLAPGLDRGFDFYDNFPKQAEAKSRWGRIERRGMDVVQRAEKWLNTHPKSPHFVWLHLYDPHDPYEPPAPYSEMYKDRLYDGEIAYADSALGHFISYLQTQGWYDRALVVIVGDHGEGLGEHHEDTHGIFLYDSTTHVPLILKLPNEQGAGRVVHQQVRTTDILPTVLDLLSIPAPAKLDGASLRPFISGADTEPRAAFGQTDYPLRFGWAPLRSVRKDGFKFIEAPQPEFYDLRSDPDELHNRHVPWDPAVQELRRMLAGMRAKSPSSSELSAAAVPSSTIDELQALGYLGAADAGSSTDVPEPSLLPDPKDKIEEQNLLHIAMIASEDGQVTRAKTALEKLLQLNGDSAIGLSQLGHLEIGSGHYNQALEYFRRAHKLRPEDAKVVCDYGRALSLTGDFAAARDALQESVRANPKQAEARILLAQVYFRLGNDAQAKDELAAALLLGPANPETIKDVAKLLVEQGKFADAIELLEPIAGSSSKARDLLELLAQAYRGAGRMQDAQRAQLQAESSQKPKPD